MYSTTHKTVCSITSHNGVYQESSRRWSLADNESICLFSSIGNASSGGPYIKSTHELHELASQQDERAQQYEGDAVEYEMLARTG